MKKSCTCGEPHISPRVVHRYDGKPCFFGDTPASQPTGKAGGVATPDSVPIGGNDSEEGQSLVETRNAGQGRVTYLPLLLLAAWIIGVVVIFKLGHVIGNTLGK